MPVGFLGPRASKTALARRNREIVRLRDTYDLTFVVIGKRFGISATQVNKAYQKEKGTIDGHYARVSGISAEAR